MSLLLFRSATPQGRRQWRPPPSPAEVFVTRKATANDAAGGLGHTRTTGPKISPTQHLEEDTSATGTGDTVRAITASWATKAQVLELCNTPRSYHGVTEEGRVFRRNRQHLLPTGETFRRRTRSDSGEDFGEQNAIAVVVRPIYIHPKRQAPQQHRDVLQNDGGHHNG
ncbi:hypothetical protein HPB49_022356 [Dermacentor silvarum]|uniref:Uncharacterized protein n=1 Tax=Dermacentor silvarum TaxID=543639 RepID=A0ACB8CMR1_DERSI|nr:hypothetical protein HPB49_022356 [Dermacentor silvarum]